MKRRRSQGPSEHNVPVKARKKPRQIQLDRISWLSDELLLRVLSHLSTSSLALCQRVSHRFSAIAGDPQLWKSAYYNRFVRPRAFRIPGVREEATKSDLLVYSSRKAKWLDEETLVRDGKETDWKRQYRLRHNWSRGRCGISEIEVSEKPSKSPLLVRLHEGILVTVDLSTGLRAWSMRGGQIFIGSAELHHEGLASGSRSTPTSLAISSRYPGTATQLDITVGFDDGHFSFYTLVPGDGSIIHRYSHPPSHNGGVTAMALYFPYLLTMAGDHLLSLYAFPDESHADSDLYPRLLLSLNSHTVWPPLSLSLRSSSEHIVASIAYAIPTYLSGWSVGLQELRLTSQGEITESRIASSCPQGFVPVSLKSTVQSAPPRTYGSPKSSFRDSAPRLPDAPPTSLSYAHPYLLVSHPDNTLTLYLVNSTSAGLRISDGTRLWGHTSSVSGAHVGERGKAVSVSSRGEELRVWELEGGVASSSSRRRLATGDLSVRVRAEVTQQQATLEHPIEGLANPGLVTALGQGLDEMAVSRGWVDFDDEKVVVLREKSEGKQALMVYDFT